MFLDKHGDDDLADRHENGEHEEPEHIRECGRLGCKAYLRPNDIDAQKKQGNEQKGHAADIQERIEDRKVPVLEKRLNQ